MCRLWNLCEYLSASLEILNRKAQIKDENANCITEAANSCPQGVIILEENKAQEEPSTSQALFYL